MKVLTILLALTFSLLAGNLTLQSGSVTGLTGVMGDAKIDPQNEALSADVSMMGSDISTIKGSISIELALFKSENADRDANMYETLESEKFTFAKYTINKTTPTNSPNIYRLNGELEFHGVKKELDFEATIMQDEATLSIDAKSRIDVEDFGIEMPCLLGFTMCVNNYVAINGVAIFKKTSLSNTIKQYVDKMSSLY